MRTRLNSSLVATISVVVTALVIAVSCVVLLVVVGVGNFQTTQEGTEQPPPVLASVEVGSVERSLEVQVHTLPVFSLEVPAGQFGAGVVTSPAAAEGTALNEGAVLVTVNELPVIVIQGAAPAYRSLGPGARGNDVKQLQDYLRRAGYVITDKDGSFGQSTARALSDHDKSKGFPAVTADGAPASSWRDSGLPLSRYVFVASAPVLVGAGCGRIGQSADSIECVLNSSSQTVTISHSSEEVLKGLPILLRTTTGVELRATVGDPVTPAVVASSDDEPEPAATPEYWYGLVDVPADASNALSEFAVVVAESTPADGLRVPVTAIREAADGKTFIRDASHEEGDSSEADYPVEVVLCADGYCAVRGEGIVAGMKAVLLG